MQKLLNIIDNYQAHILMNTKAFQELKAKLEQIDREIYGNEIDPTPLICKSPKDSQVLLIRKDVIQKNIPVDSYGIIINEKESDCNDNKHLNYFHLLKDELHELQQGYCDLNTSSTIINNVAFNLDTINGPVMVTFEIVNGNIIATIRVDNVSVKYNIGNYNIGNNNLKSNRNKKKNKKRKEKTNVAQQPICKVVEVTPNIISEEEAYNMLKTIDVLDVKVEETQKDDSLNRTSAVNKEKKYSFHFDGLHDYTTYNVSNVMITYDSKSDQVVSVYPSIISEEEALYLLREKGIMENVELTATEIPKSR